MELEEIKKSYQRKQEIYRTMQENLNEEIEKVEAKLQKLQEKSKNMAFPHFKEHYIKPLAEELLKYFPGRRYEILGTFGITCETSIHFYKNEATRENLCDGDNCVSVSFRPCYVKDEPDLVLVNQKEDTGKFAQGTIGELNGVNHPEISMPKTIKQLVQFIKEQNKDKEGENK